MGEVKPPRCQRCRSKRNLVFSVPAVVSHYLCKTCLDFIARAWCIAEYKQKRPSPK